MRMDQSHILGLIKKTKLMHWSDKMQAVLVGVMGPGYFVVILSSTKYAIHKDPEGFLVSCESFKPLESNWEDLLERGMKVVFSNILRSELEKHTPCNSKNQKHLLTWKNTGI